MRCVVKLGAGAGRSVVSEVGGWRAVCYQHVSGRLWRKKLVVVVRRYVAGLGYERGGHFLGGFKD